MKDDFYELVIFNWEWGGGVVYLKLKYANVSLKCVDTDDVLMWN